MDPGGESEGSSQREGSQRAGLPPGLACPQKSHRVGRTHKATAGLWQRLGGDGDGEGPDRTSHGAEGPPGFRRLTRLVHRVTHAHRDRTRAAASRFPTGRQMPTRTPHVDQAVSRRMRTMGKDDGPARPVSHGDDRRGGSPDRPFTSRPGYRGGYQAATSGFPTGQQMPTGIPQADPAGVTQGGARPQGLKPDAESEESAQVKGRSNRLFGFPQGAGPTGALQVAVCGFLTGLVQAGVAWGRTTVSHRVEGPPGLRRTAGFPQGGGPSAGPLGWCPSGRRAPAGMDPGGEGAGSPQGEGSQHAGLPQGGAGPPGPHTSTRQCPAG
jgi:hypothetical protein